MSRHRRVQDGQGGWGPAMYGGMDPRAQHEINQRITAYAQMIQRGGGRYHGAYGSMGGVFDPRLEEEKEDDDDDDDEDDEEEVMFYQGEDTLGAEQPVGVYGMGGGRRNMDYWTHRQQQQQERNQQGGGSGGRWGGRALGRNWDEGVEDFTGMVMEEGEDMAPHEEYARMRREEGERMLGRGGLWGGMGLDPRIRDDGMGGMGRSRPRRPRRYGF